MDNQAKRVSDDLDGLSVVIVTASAQRDVRRSTSRMALPSLCGSAPPATSCDVDCQTNRLLDGVRDSTAQTIRVDVVRG